MASNGRNRIFADFIKKQFPSCPENILDVACGDGRLSVQLSQTFPFAEVTGIDPKPRGNKRRIKIFKGTFPHRVKINEYDLIVGMHPDGATWPIVEKCCLHKIPFAVVPCCLVHVPPSFSGGNMHSWVRYIVSYSQHHGMTTMHNVLKMRGANQVVVSIPNN